MVAVCDYVLAEETGGTRGKIEESGPNQLVRREVLEARAGMAALRAKRARQEGNLKEASKKLKSLEVTYPYPALLKMKLEGIENRLEKKLDQKDNKAEYPLNIPPSEKLKPRKGHRNARQSVQG